MKRQLAVLGGSFNPPHIGHVFLAAYARSVADVELVVVAPTFEHAFGKPLSDFDHRMRMSELAFAPINGVAVSPIERELGGVSRTLRLVVELTRRYPNHQLRLLVGGDILQERTRWQRFDDIVAIAPLLVADRRGFSPSGQVAAPLLPQVSSSETRQLFAKLPDAQAERDLASWLPYSVRTYIAQHGLYRPNGP